MRQLEHQRQRLDAEALDIEHALTIRECTLRGTHSLLGRRYGDAARAVYDVNSILHGKGGSSSSGIGGIGTGIPATDRAKDLAGSDTLAAHVQTTTVLRRAIEERYEASVVNGDIAGLSELTPLLGMLDMTELGVRLYLQYSQSVLCREMNLDVPHVNDDEETNTNTNTTPGGEESTVGGGTPPVLPPHREEGMSRAAMRRRAEEQRKARQNLSVPGKLAKIYNSAVTHLRHHLPMVAYALGEADGDAALIQLVHVETEKRAVDILREYMTEKELGRTVRRAEAVASKVENRYTGGGGGYSTSGGGSSGGGGDESEGLFGMDESNIASVILGLGASGGDTVMDVTSRRNTAQRNDCGFTIEIGTLSDVDRALEEWALVLQHTESYERFVRHAVEEVRKARRLRQVQKWEERKRSMEIANARSIGDGGGDSGGDASVVSSILTPTHTGSKMATTAAAVIEDEPEVEDRLEILPPRTALNEVAAEIGGYYSSLERCLLLAGMQRAFIHANFPDESTFTNVAIGTVTAGSSSNTYSSIAASGSRALQTILVDECLFAVQRSTLRAFATGHTGVASAAANVCVDVLGRVLLDVLTRRAELGASLVKPGEGLLDGQSRLGQVALTFAKTTVAAGKGFRGVPGATVRGGVARVGDEATTTVEAMKQRTWLGVARAVASFNDLEVVVDYTKRLEANFLKEIDAGYPRGHVTEQLRMCVKGLGGVVDAFSQASTRSMEELIATLVPRVKQIVIDAVGQENSSVASNFLGTAVLTPVGAPASAKVVLDYNLDDAAFELSQISEGYIGRLCTSLDELIEPLRIHLLPQLSDGLVLGISGGVAKRLESAIRKSSFTPLGAMSLDSDIRYLMNFVKDRIESPKLKSNVTLCKSCPPLARLNQITVLLNVDDLEDALDLISVSKRKGSWDLKLDDVKTLLSLRVDFEGSKVNDLLQFDDEC